MERYYATSEEDVKESYALVENPLASVRERGLE
jgi:hypothetical protein